MLGYSVEMLISSMLKPHPQISDLDENTFL